ncbi:MAG: hypothetical protein HY549_00485 [Elusimicrobia bacterium]|nr:hypothetical protein [Elusimicrobiota bacterium]
MKKSAEKLLMGLWGPCLLAALPSHLGSENVNLSTYYPAPSGVYTQMITTDRTILARDAAVSSRVGVGTSTPQVKFHVAGDAAFTGGSVGIGMTNPNANLAVAGGAIIAGNTPHSGPNPGDDANANEITLAASGTPLNPLRVFFGSSGSYMINSQGQMRVNSLSIAFGTGGSQIVCGCGDRTLRVGQNCTSACAGVGGTGLGDIGLRLRN